MAEKQIPGLSVAIVQHGELAFAKGYGFQSIEFERPADADSVYPISSVSRIIAGVLAIRLARAGKLDLNASIDQFFSDITDDKKPITVRHLLQHTHGLEDFYRSDIYRSEKGKSEQESTVNTYVFAPLGIEARYGDSTVVSHEGGGASWVVYYPEQDLAIIALSNMSMARADMLPYEIARAVFGD